MSDRRGHPGPRLELLRDGATRPKGENRLLLLAPHFPPGTGAGALRWQKLCAHLDRAGWAVDAVTMPPENLPQRDDERLAELPASTRVFAVRGVRSRVDGVERVLWRLYRRLRPGRSPQFADTVHHAGSPADPVGASLRRVKESFARGELTWSLDVASLERAFHAVVAYTRERAWAAAAETAVRDELGACAHRAVISSGPPHMVHVAAAGLGRHLGAAFIMDLRDPWSLVERLPAELASPLWLALARRHEREAMRVAAAVVVNTDAHRIALQAAYPSVAHRIVTVMNGCDDDGFPAAVETGRFVIAYTGTIYLDRDPRPLFRAAARFVREEGLGPDRFGIELMGEVRSLDGESVEAMAAAEGLADFVQLHPPASRRNALELMARAAMLVSLPQDSAMAIPSKIFEYMSFRAWLLALTEEGTATDLLLRDSGADVLRPWDEDGIRRAIRERYAEFAAGVRPRPLGLRPEFSRAAQAARLLDVLERLSGVRRRVASADAVPEPASGAASVRV